MCRRVVRDAEVSQFAAITDLYMYTRLATLQRGRGAEEAEEISSFVCNWEANAGCVQRNQWLEAMVSTNEAVLSQLICA